MRGHRVDAVAIQRRQGDEDDVEPLSRQPELSGDDEIVLEKIECRRWCAIVKKQRAIPARTLG